MPRETKETDFELDVPGVGRYVFARRQLRDTFTIRGLYARHTASNYEENGLPGDLAALAYCTISVLAVEQPKDFHIENIDPLVDVKYGDKLIKVYFALSAKEDSFRPKPKKDSAAAGAESGENVPPVDTQNV